MSDDPNFLELQKIVQKVKDGEVRAIVAAGEVVKLGYFLIGTARLDVERHL